jgi:hypothetical protein
MTIEICLYSILKISTEWKKYQRKIRNSGITGYNATVAKGIGKAKNYWPITRERVLLRLIVPYRISNDGLL